MFSVNSMPQVISGREGTDYGSVEHVLRLQVHDWREKSMSFRLEELRSRAGCLKTSTW
jgi:uncharacterized protein YheU (UPF0270 family)